MCIYIYNKFNLFFELIQRSCERSENSIWKHHEFKRQLRSCKFWTYSNSEWMEMEGESDFKLETISLTHFNFLY